MPTSRRSKSSVWPRCSRRERPRRTSSTGSPRTWLQPTPPDPIPCGAVDLFEWQAKELFGKYDVPVTKQVLATTPAEARAAAETLGGPVMVKAQVKAGGRGKAGGVKYAPTPDDAERYA